MNKKGQGMPLNVIIIAALALIVLIVLVVIFSTRAGKFSEGTKEIEEQFSINQCEIPGTGRKCYPISGGCPSGSDGFVEGKECGQGEICCE